MIVGVLHFAPNVSIVESAAYLLRLDQAGVTLGPKLDEGIPRAHEDDCVSGLMTAPIWHRTKDRRFLSVRFMHAFPDANGWTVFGVCDALDIELDGTGHAWIDVQQGLCAAVEAPMNTAGMQMGQLLDVAAVWPGPDGTELYTLPKIMAQTRFKYLELTKLGARRGAGEITSEQYLATIAARDDWMSVRPYSIDEDYLRYLHRLDIAGGIELAQPRTAAKHAAMQQRTRELVSA